MDLWKWDIAFSEWYFGHTLKFQGGQEGLLNSIDKYVLWAWILTGFIMRAEQIQAAEPEFKLCLGAGESPNKYT